MSANFERCSPLRNAVPLISTFSDEQVAQVKQRIALNDREARDEILQQSRADYVNDQFKRSRKWLKRFELPLNHAQKEHLRQTLASQQITREQQLNLWTQWQNDFVLTFDARTKPQFFALYQRQLERLSHLEASAYPAERQFNQQLWHQFLLSLFNGLDDEQRKSFTLLLKRMAKTLEYVAQAKHAEGALTQAELEQFEFSCAQKTAQD